MLFAQNSHMYTSMIAKSETNIIIAITIVFLLEFAFEGGNPKIRKQSQWQSQLQ